MKLENTFEKKSYMRKRLKSFGGVSQVSSQVPVSESVAQTVPGVDDHCESDDDCESDEDCESVAQTIPSVDGDCDADDDDNDSDDIEYDERRNTIILVSNILFVELKE